MRNNNRAAAPAKKHFAEIKMNMIMRICRVSRARALEIIAERAAEKAAKEAEKSAARETFRQRIAERKKHLANCG